MREKYDPAWSARTDLLAYIVLETTVLLDLDEILLALFFCPWPHRAGYAVLQALGSASVTVD